MLDPKEIFGKMLEEAVLKPGKVQEAFNNFHGYSFGNQMFALYQMGLRDITPGPIAPYKGWKRLGRQVRKGEKALALLMPVTSKRKVKDANGNDEVKYVSVGRFITRNFWFTLSQTFVPCGKCQGRGGTFGDSPLTDVICIDCAGTGNDASAPEFKGADIPEFSFTKALETLKITEVPFTSLNGNAMGYAKRNEIAVNPLDEWKTATRFHEIAHILLGHTADGASITDEVTREKNLKEVEAEGVAYLCVSALGLDGVEYCRGYIQNWLQGAYIPQDSAQKIFKVADKILKAGTDGLAKYQEQAA